MSASCTNESLKAEMRAFRFDREMEKLEIKFNIGWEEGEEQLEFCRLPNTLNEWLVSVTKRHFEYHKNHRKFVC